MGLLSQQRHQTILDYIRSKGRVRVTELARELGVTEVTIRRDLTQLEKNGLLKKTYGGAVPGASEMNVSVRYRQTRNLAAKRIIGRLAADLIHDGDNVYLEAGSVMKSSHLTHKRPDRDC